MTGDARRETPPSDQGDKPGLYVPAGDEGAVDSRHGGNGPRPASDLGWGKILALMVWGFVVLAFAAGGLADVTNLWWLVLVFGAAVPTLFVALQNRRPRPDRNLTADHKEERELLDMLRERGEVTPASAAMLTTLTVDGASGILEALTRKGHLEARARDGTLVYALPNWDRRSLEEPTPRSDTAVSLAGESSGPRPLAEPLSGRELEVLGIMALGRTNAEISRELFVAVGTVKAHANNIYRKLDANNRSEAVSKARDLRLLR
jgi:ATP/maltotriose-dependent transcriptional regulator MalT